MSSVWTHEVWIIAATIFASVYLLVMVAVMLFRQHMRLREKQLALEHETRLMERDAARAREEADRKDRRERDEVTRAQLATRDQELRIQVMQMDAFRTQLDRQLKELNERFASNDDRWRELNHLVLSGQRKLEDSEANRAYRKGRSLLGSEFLRSHGIEAEQVELRQDLVFVLTPFHEDLNDEFRAIITAGQKYGLKVLRGDEYTAKGDIFPQLLRFIVEAKIIVANISGRNPNVFYELGIAHALDKQVILVAKSESDIPFDVQSKLVVFYSSEKELEERLAVALARTSLAPQREGQGQPPP